jgi:hypothetical protein
LADFDSTTDQTDLYVADEAYVLHHHPRDEDFDSAQFHHQIDQQTGRLLLSRALCDRLETATVRLSPTYARRCAFTIQITWLRCGSPPITDWVKSMSLNASKFGFRVVPVPRETDVGQSRNYFLVVKEVSLPEADAEFRRRLMLLLMREYMYLADRPSLGERTRLIHASGLCMVWNNPDGAGLQWCENYMFKSCTVEQRTLFQAFCDAERRVKARMTPALISRHGSAATSLGNSPASAKDSVGLKCKAEIDT